MPKISVIVPVYNVEKYLPACIDSILAQTYEDFELILVDDGSPDQCGVICDRYAAQDPRIRVVHQENMGLAGARNAGMDIAGGELLTFIDSDDLVSRRYLEYLAEAVDASDADLSVCRPSEFVDANEASVISADSGARASYEVLSGKDACVAMYNGSPKVPFIACGKLFRTQLIRDLRFPVGRLHEDQAFTPFACYRAGKAASLDVPLYFYRVRDASITRDVFTVKRYDDLWAIENCIRFFEEKGEPEIVAAAQRKRQRLICTYAIYARRDGVDVPKEYRIGTVKALRYLRKNVSDDRFDYYLAQVDPKLVRPYAYIRKARRLLSRRT